jgi:hypothetical protein
MIVLHKLVDCLFYTLMLHVFLLGCITGRDMHLYRHIAICVHLIFRNVNLKGVERLSRCRQPNIAFFDEEP